MLLIDQKANLLVSKIDFAEKRIKEIYSPDSILKTYIESVTDRIGTLKYQIGLAKSEFEEFVKETSFADKDHLRTAPQRGLLRDILRSYEEIEQSFYLGIDAFLPLISVWIHQSHDENTKREHNLLVAFVKELLKLSGISEDLMTILGETYACLPLYWGNVARHIAFATYTETENLRRWVLLAHEIGHVFYDLHFEEFNSNVIPQVIGKLSERKPLNMAPRELESVIYVWAEKWIPELASDCFAVKTLGPPYAVQFMLAVLDSKPDHVDVSHPPNNMRVYFTMDLLDSLAIPDFNVDSYRGIWNSYSLSVTRPSSQYILDEEIVEAALNGIDRIVSGTPIKGKWNEILSASQALSCGSLPSEDLLSVISAMALLDPTIRLDEIYPWLLERYALDPDAS